MHAAASRGNLPHHQLIYPPSLRYLPVWTLGARPALLPPCVPDGNGVCARWRMCVARMHFVWAGRRRGARLRPVPAARAERPLRALCSAQPLACPGCGSHGPAAPGGAP